MTPQRTGLGDPAWSHSFRLRRHVISCVHAILLVLTVLLMGDLSWAQAVAPLPAGVREEWDLDKAWREATPTRERICLNGLWRWQPAADDGRELLPQAGWGHFKVPGCWPGITDYLQKDSQTVIRHPNWMTADLKSVAAAWYQREVEVPPQWVGRRIVLRFEWLNSFAAVYVDGKKIGEIRFPGGELDVSGAVQPGKKHELSLLVVALPLKGVMLSYADTAAAKEVKGTVPRRGLCGDAYLVSMPARCHVEDVRVETSVRRGEIAFDAVLAGLEVDGRHTLRARVSDHGRQVAELTSGAFKAADLANGRFNFVAPWKPEKLWDLHTPANQYDVQLSLLDGGGNVVDTSFPIRFGFRELWIDGRDFILNGTRLYLSAVPLDNALIGAALANYGAARETMRRLKSFGINFVYTHNYDCLPGSHLAYDEILRAADDEGVLVAFTQPHFSHYDWKAADADAKNGYADHGAYYVRAAQNHPSVVFYSMSHNATGYDQDMDPDQIDGLHDPRDRWSASNAKLALRAEAIVHKLDPSRIVYHHAGGNIGSMYTINFYPNFAPIQELSDWFGHWATAGVKPLFLCEYGAPFTWDWTMYRGWFEGKREFGSAAVPWEFCHAEWNSQFLGDRAFAIQDEERADLRWEAKQFAKGNRWHRWDYPVEVSSPRFMDRHTVLAEYITDNWRAYRTWGVSGISPWEYGHFWSLRPGVDRGRKALSVDWEHLQQPGFSADYIDHPFEQMDVAYNASDWAPTEDGKALLSNNQPVLAYIAGSPGAFTEKGHNFFAGQTVEKQLIVINNSRRKIAFRCEWSLGLPRPLTRGKEIIVETGQQSRLPLRFHLPADLKSGAYEVRATVHFDQGEEQSDTFAIHVLSPVTPARMEARVALFDPRGQSAGLLATTGVRVQRVEADADLSKYDVLIVGKHALTVDGPAPDISRIRDGLKVVVFEQSAEVLEKRLGFRVVEYGLRNVFERIPDHPILRGLDAKNLRDWQGEATAVPPRLTYELRPQHGPTVNWCDIPMSRVWRCGTHGGVASVLIEKPARGDFLPILDGGFSLQYAPLMEYHEGKGMILFCQLDVTGRSKADPAAEMLVENLLKYVAAWKPAPSESAVYVGEPEGRAHLQSIGINPAEYKGGDLDPGRLLIAGPGVSGPAHPTAEVVRKFLASGGRVLSIGLDQADADALLPVKVTLTKAEHISAVFEPPLMSSPFAGVGAADVHNRDPRQVPLLTGGATILGDGVLGYVPDPTTHEPRAVFVQLAPWHFGAVRQPNIKRTYRRTSFLLTRILANLGVRGATPLPERFATPVTAGAKERWESGLYLDQPQEWDDPYRFFRW